jgi:S-adenosylmethionine synthetase
MSSYIVSAESVTEGHPDKIADRISDAILDNLIQNDKNCRVSVETLISKGLCVISGEITTKAYAPIQEIARDVLRNIGYTDASFGFDYRSAGVLNGIGEQSCDVKIGVDKSNANIGAGDSSIVVGYACNETKEYLPQSVVFAHKISSKLTEVRKNGTLSYLRPDGKVQIALEYENKKVKRVHTIIISAQHSEMVTNELLIQDIKTEVINKVIPLKLLDENTIIHINPTGRFVVGGPTADTGMTGRKSVIDSYGPTIACGGGAFSGKDPTKIDRSGAYMARYIAKNFVATGLFEQINIQLGYCISKSKPVSIMIDTFGETNFSNEILINCITEVFDLSVSGIINSLNLLEPIYEQTTNYGHFGKSESVFNWEKLDKVGQIKEYLSEF